MVLIDFFCDMLSVISSGEWFSLYRMLFRTFLDVPKNGVK